MDHTVSEGIGTNAWSNTTHLDPPQTPDDDAQDDGAADGKDWQQTKRSGKS
jgi:hypothetical protein